MRKLAVLTAVALFSLQGIAQGRESEVEEFGLFDHLSAGISLGTTGIGIEVAAPLNNFLQLRAGYSFMPKIKVNIDKDLRNPGEDYLRKEDGSGYYDRIEAEAKLNMGDFKLLLDYYPFKKGTFRVTAGAYIGSSKLATVKTTNHFINQGYWGNSGPELGNASQTYTVVSDAEGHVNVDAKVGSFKPYLGIGVGRAVPKKNLNVCFDFGVQFWGKPAAWTLIDDNVGSAFRKVDKDRILSDKDYCQDIRDGLKTAEKIFVYPVLTVRLNGRIF
ncbi:MAG: hypothetical protein IJV24_01815 [Prevotella sp.]|nr:hypothetical protein [Prevotella sp.]